MLRLFQGWKYPLYMLLLFISVSGILLASRAEARDDPYWDSPGESRWDDAREPYPPYAPAEPRDSYRPAGSPINARVLLLIPEEFDRYEYFTSRRGREMAHPLGMMAADELGMLMHSVFTSASTKPVRSEADAMAMLSRSDADYPDLRYYDFVAIPKFLNVSSWSRPFEYGYEVDLLVEFYSTDMAKVTKIKGRGESRTGAHAGSSPQESARLALRTAVSAIKDGLEGRPDFFYPAP